ncbi:718fb051-a8ab-4442-9f83-319be0672c7c [Thermothielavioides terrestris]|uniref:718fb051-a8ab-4442-9f83-319be0672c7c n=1 Tax=Thermothielavioides terrestris TaxID=2587410 RepID=A0A3S4AMU8_9PEZI|nr:718fb051-a8ab-4442-9f83-319be0672c7c [Thermothielavioides terrestris]
MATGLEFIA